MNSQTFSEEQIHRYSRQILLQEIGVEGQRKLLESSAFVVGAGGLGSPALVYLAGAGVGKIGIADGDRVEISNLHRQIIHQSNDVDKNKALSAQETMTEMNPDCQIEIHQERLTEDNIRDILKEYDVVLDGSDNFATRFLVSDCCKFENIPLVSSAVIRFEGQLMTVLPEEGNPCYRCFLPEPPPPGLIPSCREAGVLGPVAGVMGTLQAVEALKVLLNLGNIMSHHLLLYDALSCIFSRVKRSPDPECPLCGVNKSITDLVEYDVSCMVEPDDDE